MQKRVTWARSVDVRGLGGAGVYFCLSQYIEFIFFLMTCKTDGKGGRRLGGFRFAIDM